MEALDRLTVYGLLDCRSPGRYTLHQTIAEYALYPAQDEAADQRGDTLQAREEAHKSLKTF